MSRAWVQGSGFRVQGPGFRVQGSVFRVQGSGFRFQGAGFRHTRTCEHTRLSRAYITQRNHEMKDSDAAKRNVADTDITDVQTHSDVARLGERHVVSDSKLALISVCSSQALTHLDVTKGNTTGP